MTPRTLALLCALGLGGLAACDGLGPAPPVAVTAKALIVLDRAVTHQQSILDVGFIPSPLFESLHGKLDKRVLITIRASYEPIPGPDPSPAHLVVDVSGPSVVRSHGLELALSGAGPRVYAIEALLEASCDDELCAAGPVVEVHRLDRAGGRVTLDVDLRE